MVQIPGMLRESVLTKCVAGYPHYDCRAPASVHSTQTGLFSFDLLAWFPLLSGRQDGQALSTEDVGWGVGQEQASSVGRRHLLCEIRIQGPDVHVSLRSVCHLQAQSGQGSLGWPVGTETNRKAIPWLGPFQGTPLAFKSFPGPLLVAQY